MLNTKININHIRFFIITFLSGFAGIFFETISNKVFSYFFGVTLVSTTVTISIFFLGLSVGSYFFTQLTSKAKSYISLYLINEAILSIFLFAYPSLYERGFTLLTLLAGQGSILLWPVKVFIMIILLFIPAFLMGGTIPLLFGILSRFYSDDRYIPKYYGLNTLGATLGVIISSYFLFPSVGIAHSSYLACAINLCVFLLLFNYYKTTNGKELVLKKFQFSTLLSKETGIKINDRFLQLAFLSGFIVFAFEIIWFNLLALIIGNSVYAFAIMLATVLTGIGAGSYFVSTKKFEDRLTAFRNTQLLLVLHTSIMMFFWDKLGGIFSSVGLFNPSFGIMELTRFFISFIVLLFPCLLIGISFPLIMQEYTQVKKSSSIAVGALYAVNSIGSMLGLIVGSFIFINYLGNKVGLNLVASFSLVSIYIVLSMQHKVNKKWVFLLCIILIGRFFITPDWNILKMTGGQNIYFSGGNTEKDKIIFHKESTYSGIITLIEKSGIKTLFTNGKFEGNNSTEILDQYLFSLIPAIFSENYNSAANLGLGVGGSLGAVTQFPYKHIDVIEISPEIIEVAQNHFSSVNFNGLKDKRVTTHLEDGRIYFMGKKDKYDLITMESSSIWFSGSANLYSKEFYQIIRNSLTEGGVFQQWIQLHHISKYDIGRIIKTFKSYFKYPTLWIMGHQAIIVAKKNMPISIDYEKAIMLQNKIKVNKLLNKIGYNSIFNIFNHLTLSSENITELLNQLGIEKSGDLETHTDMNPILEFSTPRGNSLKNAYETNRALLFDYKRFKLNEFIKNIPSDKIYKKIAKKVYFDVYGQFFKHEKAKNDSI